MPALANGRGTYRDAANRRLRPGAGAPTDVAERYKFRGSPTLLIDGVDPFADLDAPIGLSCRLYKTEHGYSGAPTLDQLRAVLDEANTD